MDEVEEVLALLTRHGIEHYLTPAGPFGISAGGIWLRHEDDCDRAKALFDDYQKNRAAKALAEQDAAKAEGKHETFMSLWRRRPLYVTLMIVLSVMVLMIFFAPMLQIAQTTR